MEHHSPSRATVARRVRERLTAIKLHAGALRRKTSRGEPLDPTLVKRQMDLIEHEADAVAAAMDELQEPDASA